MIKRKKSINGLASLVGLINSYNWGMYRCEMERKDAVQTVERLHVLL